MIIFLFLQKRQLSLVPLIGGEKNKLTSLIYLLNSRKCWCYHAAEKSFISWLFESDGLMGGNSVEKSANISGWVKDV